MRCECLHPDSLLGCGTRAQAAALYADARRRCPEHGLTRNTILQGDVRERLRELPDESVHCVVTSPPYWGLRDYGVPGQIGLEATPEEYVENMVAVFREIRRVLRKDGVCWLNLGDCYAGSGKGLMGDGTHSPEHGTKQGTNRGTLDLVQVEKPTYPGLKPKDLVGIPWRVAFALQADGWWLRSDIIWSKPNPMPESVTDRPTKAHEYIFLLSKSATYYYDADAIREKSIGLWNSAKGFSATGIRGANTGYDGAISNQFNGTGTPDDQDKNGRNKRTVWEVATQPYPGAHFATYPEALVRPCILAGTSEYGCCAECGAPWRRVVERGLTAHDGETASAYAKGTTANRLALLRQAARQRGSEYVNESRTTGWEPTCKHDAPTVPALVLDPFFGSGTTGLVAAKAGRDWIGIELNPDYVRLAEQRLIHVKARLL